MSLIIDPQLHQKFKLAATAQGTEMSAVLVKFIQDYVKKYLPADLKSQKGGRK